MLQRSKSRFRLSVPSDRSSQCRTPPPVYPAALSLTPHNVQSAESGWRDTAFCVQFVSGRHFTHLKPLTGRFGTAHPRTQSSTSLAQLQWCRGLFLRDPAYVWQHKGFVFTASCHATMFRRLLSLGCACCAPIAFWTAVCWMWLLTCLMASLLPCKDEKGSVKSAGDKTMEFQILRLMWLLCFCMVQAAALCTFGVDRTACCLALPVLAGDVVSTAPPHHNAQQSMPHQLAPQTEQSATELLNMDSIAAQETSGTNTADDDIAEDERSSDSMHSLAPQ